MTSPANCQHRRHPVDPYCVLCEEIFEHQGVVRCDRHAGDPYPSRCYECDQIRERGAR